MDRSEWNALVEKYAPPFGAFLQAWEWGELQTELGFEVVRVYEEVNGQILLAQALKYPLPLKSWYWHVPKGPLGNVVMSEALPILKSKLPGGAFLKIEPGTRPDQGSLAKDRQPSVTTVVDLTLPYEQLLENMKPKTRYNIRLAEKKGVTAKIVGLEHFEDFAKIMTETAERDGFQLHEIERYRTMLRVLTGNGCRAFLAMAWFEDKPLAANIMLDAFGVRTYLHGASSNLYRNLMAPYALHDFLIRDAQAADLKSYDFWGVAPLEAGDDHPWAGISRFKHGFGGQAVSMPGTFDIQKSALWFNLYKLAKKIRK